MSQTKPSEKLQKVVASFGLGSRREVEKWISTGRIKVNGKIAELGMRVTDTDKILIDDKPLRRNKETTHRTIVYNKPVGEVCSRNDPDGRVTIFDRMPKLVGQRWVSVGRLDINTSGLIILTTDGELANRLMHPSYDVDREYAVRIHGVVDDDMIKRLKEGVLLEDGMARFTDVQPYKGEGLNRWFHVVLMEGRNREVRRLWESQDVQVSRLKRVRYGCIFLPSRVKQGYWEELSPKDVNALRELVQLPSIKVTQIDMKGKDGKGFKRARRAKRPRNTQ